METVFLVSELGVVGQIVVGFLVGEHGSFGDDPRDVQPYIRFLRGVHDKGECTW